MATRPIVFVVDDDPGTLRSICEHIARASLPVQPFRSGIDFLKAYAPGTPGCLVLDLRLPEIDGLALAQHLAEQGDPLPVIIVTGAGDVPSCIRAFKLGVFDFLEKPLDGDELIDCVQRALAKRIGTAEPAHSRRVRQTLSCLTPGERVVLDHLLAGKTLKQIARLRSVSVQSVWRHRYRILKKFAVANEVELARVLLERGEAHRMT